MTEKNKCVTLKAQTYRELTELKEYGQSYDGIIYKLIQVYKNVILEVN